MILQHVDKTMTDEESEKLMGEALAELESQFSATLRS
jgi:phenylalanyl-tRNA synthetase beta subunit